MDRQAKGSIPAGRIGLSAALPAVLVLVASLFAVTPVRAQGTLTISTPYPQVAVEPGADLTFPLTVATSEPHQVSLAVQNAPPEWTTQLRGGGFTVAGVFSDPAQEEPPAVELTVSVPDAVTSGVFEFTVVATADPALTASLPLTVTVNEAAGGSVTLTAQFPQLRGPADANFSFSLTLENDTPRDATFELDAQGPEGWQVDARPSTEEQATSATVTAGSSATINVTAEPPTTVTAGVFPILVRASSGERVVEAPLQVEVTGDFGMELGTPDERLNTQASAGTPKQVQFVVTNTGSTTLQGVELSATPPSNWTVEFEPEALEAIPPQQQVTVNAILTPATNAVTGDYVVTVTATTPEVDATQQLRVTVETSLSWALVGIGLILVTLAVLAWVFRTYGRR